MTAPEPKPLDVIQRLGLAKHLSGALGKLRSDELEPEAHALYPPGSRLPVKYGDSLAGWVTFPQKSRTASVTDKAELLAWAKANYPDRVVPAEAIDPKHMKDVLAILADRLPEAIVKTEVADPQWVDDLLTALKSSDGRWVDKQGTVHREIPGITTGESGGTPQVKLDRSAGDVIGQAWRDGLITLDGLLAIEAPTTEGGGK